MKRHTKRATYPPGFFSALVKRHNWPPGFVSQIERAQPQYTPPVTTDAQRERQIAAGTGWGSGTMAMPGTPKRPRPGWMR